MNYLFSRIRKFSLLGIFIILVFSCKPAKENDIILWPEQTSETKPWSRTWWMGSAVNKDDLTRLMKKYSEAGIGGLEITPIYGAKGYEDQYIEFLSPEWIDILRFTISEARKNNMGIDLNLGTGWPYGGPHITPEYAAKRLVIRSYLLNGGETLTEKILPQAINQRGSVEELVSFFAYGPDGEKLDVIDKVDDDGHVAWVPEDGKWELYAAFSQNTGQLVKRAAPGGEGLTVDPFSKESLQVYLSRFEETFDGNYPEIRSVFDDSYEVYQASFTPDFFNEFEQRRGYDAREYLRELSGEGQDSEMNNRVQADYRKTISDLLIDCFTVPWDHWASQHNYLSRLQAHGSPGNLLDLYGAAAIPEGETFGSNRFPISGLQKYTIDKRNIEPDPVMMKFASSAAHVTGKNLVSSETFTWLGEHFNIPLSECKPELEMIFLAGVNHMFFHGTTYSPEEAGWPGWLFYATVHFNPNNSFWPHLRGMNDYISRCQSILQSGMPDNDVVIYWPVNDLWHHTGSLDRLFTVHNIDNWLHPTPFYQVVDELSNHGYTMDFISDRQLSNAKADNHQIISSSGGNPYKALIIPETEFMDISTLENIIDLARDGSTVIFSGFPNDVPGYFNLEERRGMLRDIISGIEFTEISNTIKEYKTGKGVILLVDDVKEALRYININREPLVDTGLKFTRRSVKDGKYYYLVNHTENHLGTTITIYNSAKTVVLLDPQNGHYGEVPVYNNTGKSFDVKVKIKSGEALFIRTFEDEVNDLEPWLYYAESSDEIIIDGMWTLNFVDGGPHLPNEANLEQLISWTELPDENAVYFSGTAIYETEFELPGKNVEEYMICLGEVHESARVWINEKEVGYLWSVPYQANVGKYLEDGTNSLRIEVTNLMANRIRYMDLNDKEWRKFHDINFVNLAYQPFDASVWEPMTSGLLGPVRIIPLVVE